jgi:phosphatidylglycerol---prolipoprotein diacylglyceryl transferase
MDLLAAIGWQVLDRFRLGDGFAISPHGLGIAVGYLAGSYVFLHEARKRGYPEDAVNSIIFWALVGTVIGSRLGYVFTHLSEFDSPSEVIRIWEGGLSQLGGVVGAIMLSYVVVRRRGLHFVRGLDAAAIPIPLGVVIGRVGDLIIGDHLGKPTSWLLGFAYEGGSLSGYSCSEGTCITNLVDGYQQVIEMGRATLTGPTGTLTGVGVHQTALYDFFLTMLLVILLVYLNGRPRRTGVLFLTYVTWYGIGRIITDFLRIENRFLGLTGSQWTSTLAVSFAVATLLWFALRPTPAEEPEFHPLMEDRANPPG